MKLGAYELLFPLAQGGMATVWLSRVRDSQGQQQYVALKTILPQYMDDQEFRTMFLDEGRLSMRLRSPNIATVFDVGEDGNQMYMAIQWVDGDAWSKLQSVAQRNLGGLPLNLSLRIAADACRGLHAAHELRNDDGQSLGIVHRDVSPQNVLIGVDGIARVIDFGVAKAVDRMAKETNAGTIKGKLLYCAPEQALGKPVDRRADIWAIGAILYKAASGRPPYEGENELAVLHQLMSGQPPAPLPESVPASVRSVIERALAREPNKRFNTALQMATAIESAMHPVVTHEEVAKFLTSQLGNLIERRHEQLAQVTTALDAGTLGTSSAVTGFELVRPTGSKEISSSSVRALTPSAGSLVSMVTSSTQEVSSGGLPNPLASQLPDEELPPEAPLGVGWMLAAAVAVLVLLVGLGYGVGSLAHSMAKHNTVSPVPPSTMIAPSASASASLASSAHGASGLGP